MSHVHLKVQVHMIKIVERLADAIPALQPMPLHNFEQRTLLR